MLTRNSYLVFQILIQIFGCIKFETDYILLEKIKRIYGICIPIVRLVYTHFSIKNYEYSSTSYYLLENKIYRKNWGENICEKLCTNFSYKWTFRVFRNYTLSGRCNESETGHSSSYFSIMCFTTGAKRKWIPYDRAFTWVIFPSSK